MPKTVQFGEFLKTWGLWSNSVTRRVNFKGQKLVENAKIEKFKCDHFWWFSNIVLHWNSNKIFETGFFEYIGVLLGHGKLFTYLLYLTVVLTLNPSKVPEVRKYLSTWLCSIRLSPKSFPAPIVYCGTGSGSSLFFWLFNCLLILLLVLFGTESGFSIGVRGLLSYSVVVAGRSPSMPASPGSRVEEVLFL